MYIEKLNLQIEEIATQIEELQFRARLASTLDKCVPGEKSKIFLPKDFEAKYSKKMVELRMLQFKAISKYEIMKNCKLCSRILDQQNTCQDCSKAIFYVWQKPAPIDEADFLKEKLIPPEA